MYCHRGKRSSTALLCDIKNEVLSLNLGGGWRFFMGYLGLCDLCLELNVCRIERTLLLQPPKLLVQFVSIGNLNLKSDC